MTFNRRSFIQSTALAFAGSGSIAQVILSTTPAAARGYRAPFRGYGRLVADPAGLLDLPKGFTYRVLSREGDTMGSSLVPGAHDGMAAFRAPAGASWLVRNHEVDAEAVEEDGVLPVPHVAGKVYDPEAVGGTTTLLVSRHGRVLDQRVSLAGTTTNCAGGPTPWDTWLSCEEDDATLAKPHGYVFEVDPRLGGNPEPIRAMGRFEHEAVAFDRHGRAYLTEDADGPFGCFYRFSPRKLQRGCGSLHAGGKLRAMAVAGIESDLSIVKDAGLVLPVSWIDVPNVDPRDDEASVREQVILAGATPISKAEGVWTDQDGNVWFVSSRGDGPDAEDEEDQSAALHAGQIWKYDPRAGTIELVVIFPGGSPYDGPDNITISPHGFALACTDGEDDQWLVGINEAGGTFEFAKNPADDAEFAGATFSADGETLFVNIQGQPAVTFAVAGPFSGRRR
jgi:secreted PhoX family phosphatase